MNIEFLRELALSLPHAREDVKWGNDLCFLIGEKMFCATNLEGSFRASFKVTDENFNLLTEREGLVPAPYLARYKWVMAERGEALNEEEWKELVRDSYEMVKAKLPKRVREGL